MISFFYAINLKTKLMAVVFVMRNTALDYFRPYNSKILTPPTDPRNYLANDARNILWTGHFICSQCIIANASMICVIVSRLPRGNFPSRLRKFEENSEKATNSTVTPLHDSILLSNHCHVTLRSLVKYEHVSSYLRLDSHKCRDVNQV